MQNLKIVDNEHIHVDQWKQYFESTLDFVLDSIEVSCLINFEFGPNHDSEVWADGLILPVGMCKNFTVYFLDSELVRVHDLARQVGSIVKFFEVWVI